MKKNRIPSKPVPNHNKGLPPQQVTFAQQTNVTTIFDPTVVSKYSEMVPDAPERILKQFEENAKVERELKVLAFESQNSANALLFRDNRRRDWMAYSIIVLLLIASGGFGYLQMQFLSGTSFVAVVAYVVAGFIAKRK